MTNNDHEAHFYLSRYTNGMTLLDFMEMNCDVPPIVLCDIVEQFITISDAFHSVGIIYRDKTQSNVTLVDIGHESVTAIIAGFAFAVDSGSIAANHFDKRLSDHILDNLGSKYRPDHRVWDEVYFFVKIYRQFVKENFISEITKKLCELESRIGRLQYKSIMTR